MAATRSPVLAALDRHQEAISKGVCYRKRCVRYNATGGFTRHELRRRQVRVIVNLIVEVHRIVIARWRCSQCGLLFTDLPVTAWYARPTATSIRWSPRASFAQDLVYRINTFEILLPALRDRIGDIRELAEHLLKRFRPNQGPPSELIQQDAIELLVSHVWPGNVRELANVLEHAIILSDDDPITAADLPPHFMDHRLVGDATSNPGPETLRETEQCAIEDALERTGGNKSRAAEQLGIASRRCTTSWLPPRPWKSRPSRRPLFTGRHRLLACAI